MRPSASTSAPPSDIAQASAGRRCIARTLRLRVQQISLALLADVFVSALSLCRFAASPLRPAAVARCLPLWRPRPLPLRAVCPAEASGPACSHLTHSPVRMSRRRWAPRPTTRPPPTPPPSSRSFFRVGLELLPSILALTVSSQPTSCSLAPAARSPPTASRSCACRGQPNRRCVDVVVAPVCDGAGCVRACHVVTEGALACLAFGLVGCCV